MFDHRRVGQRILALLLALMIPSFAMAATYATLELGSRGAEVLKMQQALLALGYDPSGVDGKFGNGTQTAVILYQTAKGLTADGKAGSQTLTALYADASGVAAGDTATDSSASGSTDSSTNNGTSSDSTVSVPTTTRADTLKYGSSGDKVKALQTALVLLGYSTNGVDGRFGAGTQKAVIAFQKANGLTADGLAGSKTQALLFSLANGSTGGSTDSANDSSTDSSSGSTTNDGTSSGGTAAFTRTLRKGYTGNDVTAAQTQLKTLGYYSGTLDGVYGTGTMAAVKAFQQKNGLTADGLVGSMSWSKLFSSDAISNSGTSADSGSSSTDDSSASNGTTDSSGTTNDSSATYTTLQLGSTGSAVKTMQAALKKLGYNVSADGNFGALTKTAVTQFQKLNGLTADGVAGALTQQKIYSGDAVAYNSSVEDATVTIDDDTGKASGPDVSSVKCLYWYTEVKPNIRTGQTATIFDPATNLQWTLRFYSLGHHADSEPLTATDTAIMYKAFGNTNTWTPKPVYVKLPSGTWTLATMHNVPHLSGSIKDNDFDGHLCVHFLRTMEECKANDPNYGVTHQNAIRKKWKQMTGVDIAD